MVDVREHPVVSKKPVLCVSAGASPRCKALALKFVGRLTIVIY
jgi:hypothetical protein